ncbi:HAD-IIIC family phosphatase [Streptomyces sp. NPDC012888]|uniref:HAD-IIIC family phosphatase n=1 Tax=Streptomyces sp. NPDC012888 TaxID=3364855 RepID=UPI00369EE945
MTATTETTAATTVTVKCVVWDLDNTVWDGVLLEDGDVTLRPGVVDVLRTLDERGILHSIASRNDHDTAMAKLEELGIADYFLYPQISFGQKSDAVKAVAAAINIGVDTLAFVDDQPFERDEVRFAHPEVLCIDATDTDGIPDLPQMRPRFVTADSRERRHLYRADARRKVAEESHTGAPEEFLASLGMRFTIAPAREDDLKRAEELTVRTNQLNATGYTYSYEELDAFRSSPDHELLVASLDDRYGSYGKIGLALVERGVGVWTLKLLLMSCRVMSRGVGSVLLNHLIRSAHDAGVALRAEFVSTDRNRTMLVTYKFSGFREVAKDGEVSVLENDFSRLQDFPPYMEVVVED